LRFDACHAREGSVGVDYPDITHHPRTLQNLALVGRSQTYLIVGQEHVHAFLDGGRRRTIDQLARFDARENFAHRLLPQVGSKDTFRHGVPLRAGRVRHGEKLGVLGQMRHCQQVLIVCPVVFGEYLAG
jgi:hypothetical protein